NDAPAAALTHTRDDGSTRLREDRLERTTMLRKPLPCPRDQIELLTQVVRFLRERLVDRPVPSGVFFDQAFRLDADTDGHDNAGATESTSRGEQLIAAAPFIDPRRTGRRVGRYTYGADVVREARQS